MATELLGHYTLRDDEPVSKFLDQLMHDHGTRIGGSPTFRLVSLLYLDPHSDFEMQA